MTNSSQTSSPTAADSTVAFITRWQSSGAAERANYQLFLTELCDILGVPKPEPTRPKVEENAYVFERDVKFQNLDGTTSIGRIDLYKRNCFVLEAKQGSEQISPDEFQLTAAGVKTPRAKKGTAVRGTKGWDDAMFKARGQAEQYARALPVDEGWPPFLIVVDVGHTIELFADFTRSGKVYLPFPDPGTHRIKLDKLNDPLILERLRATWTDPLSLDPSRRSAKVTRELAERLARLAKSLEGSLDTTGRKVDPARVAQFLMRCLFTMFAEDVDLLPSGSFTTLLKSLLDDVASFPDMVRSLWESMDKGTFSPILRQKLLQFNGGLFEDCEALPLRVEQLKLLIEASQANWREVEPAIFGTLLERALDPIERHKLGAHYTPRAYVERLVMPTIIEPLREEWDAVRAAAVTLAIRGEKDAAIEEVRDFLARLCDIRVLDPACGSGNFLYVALEHMKRIEGEILNTLRDLGGQLKEVHTVDPHQFLGIEVNPRAAAIADLVLWIGYLQWHLRTRALSDIHEPIIRKFHNIECRDAVLAWDSVERVKDQNDQFLSRWDGRTTKKHSVTGEDVPDEAARLEVVKYVNPRKADWPVADYIVGNPPFVGNKRMISALGEDYVTTLRATHSDVPESADFVMYWWHHAATLVRHRRCKIFGLITTNSVTQAFNQRVISHHLSVDPTLSIIRAIPDHPWTDSGDGAAVRIAMTVATLGEHEGLLESVIRERPGPTGEVLVDYQQKRGRVHENLRVGADVTSAVALRANGQICGQGVKLVGDGFLVDGELDKEAISPATNAPVIRLLLNPTDIMKGQAGRPVIDFFGLSADDARRIHPAAYQQVYDRVKPLRDQNRRDSIRDLWWRFAWERPIIRRALSGLSRYFVTLETSKHRYFVAIAGECLWDGSLFAIATADFFIGGTLSSRIHCVWALASGGRMGKGNDPRYRNGPCFERFPFPVATEGQSQEIREFGERLDNHRKRQQALHPALTMTGMYNVLEKLRSGEPLTTKEKVIHEQGLVSVLKQLHDELDAAVFEAYGWPATLTDEEILERLVALNAERAAEEQQGLIRWLRPEFQNPASGQKTQATLEFAEPDESDDEVPAKSKGKKKAATPAAAAAKKIPWPKTLPEQIQGVRHQLLSASKPLTPPEIAQRYSRANTERIGEVLMSLVIIGSARQLDGGQYVAS